MTFMTEGVPGLVAEDRAAIAKLEKRALLIAHTSLVRRPAVSMFGRSRSSLAHPHKHIV